jgi:hypothetical protein
VRRGGSVHSQARLIRLAMMNKSLCATLTLVFGPILLCAVSPAGAVSDDANPWLAIESALCVVHRTVDYSAFVGASVRFDTAEWTGALNGLPTHCHLAGIMTDGEPFDVKIPMVWNGQVFPASCDMSMPSPVESMDALSKGTIAAFGPVSGRTAKLLRAVSAQQRDTSFVGIPCD